MRKLIRVLIYLDTDKEKMGELVVDVKDHLLGVNNLWEKHGLHTIKVTTNGFDYFRGNWGLETPVRGKKKNENIR